MGSGFTQRDFWSIARRDVILIVGFTARTGLAAAEVFDVHGVRYKISDCAPRDTILPLLGSLRVAPLDVFTGPQSLDQLDGITKVLLSPGVPRSIPLIVEAARRGIPVVTDIDFLYPAIADKNIAAITGTDGKTTTTSLTAELLRSQATVVIAGNIGVPVLSKYDEILRADWLVLELSSFMLEQLTSFRPTIGAILNIAQDHIDRYSGQNEYASVKLGIARYFKDGDVLVKNIDDPVLDGYRPARGIVRTVSPAGAPSDSFCRDGALQVRGHRFDLTACALKGLQNIPNMLVAATIALEAGVEPAAIGHTLRTFQGLRHRMQHVGRFRDVEVYEDSKASNVHAVTAALRNFERNVVLIVGGRDKGLDFTILRPFASRIRRLICYGEHGERLRDCIGHPSSSYVYRFEDAVRQAVEQCRAGDVLLLSPGCTSWDQFPNYEVRGDVFQELVPRLFAE